MREEQGQIPGGVINEDLCLRGQIRGDANVPGGVHLLLDGQIGGTLTIENGGSAEIRGMVVGDLINRGNAKISGTVIGALRDESGGASIEPGARIGPR
jgi:cytoskeletal protein CcmA (bactofilin family)